MKEPEVVTSIRLSRDEHAWVTEFARKQHRSVSGQVRFWIAGFREQEEREAA